MAKRDHSWASWSIRAAFVWIVCSVLWVCITTKMTSDELVVGAFTSVLGTIGFLVFLRAVPITFQPRLSEVLQCWRIPWYMFAGTFEIMQGLGRQLFCREKASSLVRSVEFAVGEDVDARARTVLAVTYTTITPNFIVLGVVTEERRMIYHQILGGEVLQITINLGAKP